MNKNELKSTIADIVLDILFVLSIFVMGILITAIEKNNENYQNKINELEQQVEEQYYLIDSLKQEV